MIMKTVVLNSNSKVNIGLKILNKRHDGYHDISTVFQEINLCDILSISKTPECCNFKSNVHWLKNNKDNLCIIAYEIMKKNFDIS